MLFYLVIILLSYYGTVAATPNGFLKLDLDEVVDMKDGSKVCGSWSQWWMNLELWLCKLLAWCISLPRSSTRWRMGYSLHWTQDLCPCLLKLIVWMLYKLINNEGVCLAPEGSLVEEIRTLLQQVPSTVLSSLILDEIRFPTQRFCPMWSSLGRIHSSNFFGFNEMEFSI